MKKRFVLLLICLFLTGCQVEISVKPTQAKPEITPTKPVAEVQLPLPTVLPTVEPTRLPEPDDMELVRVAEYIPGIRLALAYATEDNFVKQPIYDFADAYLRYGTVQKLQGAVEELAQQGLGILIWDAFRPLAAQEKLWEICPDPTYVSHPVTGSRSHCRGSAIDLTLVDLKTGEPLQMPTGFDDFSELADRDYSDCTTEAASNARLLEDVMVKHGFRPYSAEWWHFSDTEEYPVDEDFCPEQTVFYGGVG